MPYTDAQPEQESFEITIVGPVADGLRRRAERQCLAHFGTCPFRIDAESCRVCATTLGGRPRLFAGHFVAHAVVLAGASEQTLEPAESAG